MQFPMRDAMTAEQVDANNAAQQYLVKGKYYRFNPPVKGGAIPTGGPNTCKLEECEFNRGWYIGFVDGNHIFQGKPIDDKRVIPVPDGYEDYEGTPELDKILEGLRDSYFAVLFIGGNLAILDADQSH